MLLLAACGGDDKTAANDDGAAEDRSVFEDVAQAAADAEPNRAELQEKLAGALEELNFDDPAGTAACLVDRYGEPAGQVLDNEDFTFVAGFGCDHVGLAQLSEFWAVPDGTAPCVLQVYTDYFEQTPLDVLLESVDEPVPGAEPVGQLVEACGLTEAEAQDLVS